MSPSNLIDAHVHAIVREIVAVLVARVSDGTSNAIDRGTQIVVQVFPEPKTLLLAVYVVGASPDHQTVRPEIPDLS